MSLFGKKEKTGNVSCAFTHIDGINGLPKGSKIKATMDDENKRLEIKALSINSESIFIRYSQLCGVSMLTEKEIQEANKSVLGRAAVGGVLLGPLGAIVGGMSGVGTKQKSETHYYVVLNYKPSSSPENIEVISFEPEALTSWSKFFKRVKEECSTQPAAAGGYL